MWAECGRRKAIRQMWGDCKKKSKMAKQGAKTIQMWATRQNQCKKASQNVGRLQKDNTNPPLQMWGGISSASARHSR